MHRAATNLILNSLLGSAAVPGMLRTRALRWLGLEIGDGVIIEPGAWFGGRGVSIGDHCYVNYRCHFDNFAPIRIGAGTELAMEVLLVTATHEFAGPEHRAGELRVGQIDIGPGCWLGARVTVLPGVTIGAGCIIAAGALVASDCEPNGLYVGLPARRVRDL